jgi:isoprenylcysteine carboxyl methyltransferase (ICMT) family protein YpbQ
MNTYLDTLPVAAAACVYAVRIVELRTRRQTIRGPIKENLTLKLFILAGTAMFIGGLAEFFLHGRQWNWLTLILGVVCAFASFGIRRQAIAALGRFWSLHVEIRENHEFVRSGPFRWMRHPAYFTMILELLSVALILQAWFTFLFAALVFVPTLFYRVHLEEQALVEKFGDTYRQYQKTTPALIPYRVPAK